MAIVDLESGLGVLFFSSPLLSFHFVRFLLPRTFLFSSVVSASISLIFHRRGQMRTRGGKARRAIIILPWPAAVWARAFICGGAKSANGPGD